jgi:hypothetical protein
MSNWISCQDEMPETGEYALVAQIHENEPMIAFLSPFGYWVEKCENLAVNGDASWSREICSATEAKDYERITHWMPLPDMPA